MSKQKKEPPVFDFSQTFDADKLIALQRFMAKKGLSLEEELCAYLERLYQRHVPKEVKEYLDFTANETPSGEKTEGDF